MYGHVHYTISFNKTDFIAQWERHGTLRILRESGCLHLSYLDPGGHLLGPRTSTCAFFTCTCCQAIHRSFSQVPFFVLPPASQTHFILTSPHCVVPLLLCPHGLFKTCTHLAVNQKQLRQHNC